ncbi:MAG: hypothetical protein REI94_15935 [Moraxellaceae bacterium]|nr:hypothetical protein [Moraxellaceae bacterium]
MSRRRIGWFVIAAVVFLAVCVATFGSHYGAFASRDLVVVSGKIRAVEFQNYSYYKSSEAGRRADFWFDGTRGRFVFGVTGRKDVEDALKSLPEVRFSVERDAYERMTDGDSLRVFGLNIAGVPISTVAEDQSRGRLSLGQATFFSLGTLALLAGGTWPRLRIL